jgi:hypothetical protein
VQSEKVVTPRSAVQPHVRLGTLKPRLTLKLTCALLFATRAFVASSGSQSSTTRLGQQLPYIRHLNLYLSQCWIRTIAISRIGVTLLTTDCAPTPPTTESRLWPHRAVGKAATHPTRIADAAETMAVQRRTTTSGRRRAQLDSSVPAVDEAAPTTAGTSATRECLPSL